jgi:hypothetical protein
VTGALQDFVGGGTCFLEDPPLFGEPRLEPAHSQGLARDNAACKLGSKGIEKTLVFGRRQPIGVGKVG